MKKMISIMLAGIMVIGILGGCSSKDNGQAEEKGGKQAEKKVEAEEKFDPETCEDKIAYDDMESEFGKMPEVKDGTSIGIIMPDLSNEYWSVLSKGMETAAKEYGVKVDIQSSMDPDDSAGQLAIADAMVKKGYDAYIMSPVSDDCIYSSAETALGEGAPVVNVVANLLTNCSVFMGNLHYDTGYAAGEYLVDKLGGKGKVAIVMGAVGGANNTGRCNGFKAALEGSDIEVAAELPAEWSSEEAMNLSIDLLARDPDIDAFFCVNDNMALGVVEALRTKNVVGDIKVVGIDGLANAYDSIEKGEMTATVEAFPSECGRIAIELCIRLLDGQKINRVVTTPLVVADIDNYKEIKGQ